MIDLPIAMPRRLVIGRPPAVPGGIAFLAARAKRISRALGYRCWIDVSPKPDSATRHVRVVCGLDWPLNIRISDHVLAQAQCDLELVSLDGRSGDEWLSAWLHAVARGESML